MKVILNSTATLDTFPLAEAPVNTLLYAEHGPYVYIKVDNEHVIVLTPMGAQRALAAPSIITNVKGYPHTKFYRAPKGTEIVLRQEN